MLEEIYGRATQCLKEENFEEAIKYLKEAADLGHAKAQYNLALCYHEGWGGYQSHEKAFRYLKKAALQGHPRAHYMLGCYFAMNLSPYTMVDEEAAYHFKTAADHGIADAQYNYGVCLLEGKGAAKSVAEAVHYFELAAKQNNPEALYNLALCTLSGNGTYRSEAKAIEYLELAVKFGHKEAGEALSKILSQSEKTH